MICNFSQSGSHVYGFGPLPLVYVYLCTYFHIVGVTLLCPLLFLLADILIIFCCCFQYLTIHLDETDCFAAWRSAREAGLESTGDNKGQ